MQAAISIVGLANLRQAVRLPSSLGDADYSLLRDILAEARKAVFSWGGRLYFVYLPTHCSAIDSCRERGGNNWPDYNYRRVPQIVRDLDIPLIDLRRPFREHEDPASLFPFRRGGHYNAVGHKLVAETVLKEIEATFVGEP